jgi:hypothetical protein
LFAAALYFHESFSFFLEIYNHRAFSCWMLIVYVNVKETRMYFCILLSPSVSWCWHVAAVIILLIVLSLKCKIGFCSFLLIAWYFNISVLCCWLLGSLTWNTPISYNVINVKLLWYHAIWSNTEKY